MHMLEKHQLFGPAQHMSKRPADGLAHLTQRKEKYKRKTADCGRGKNRLTHLLSLGQENVLARRLNTSSFKS